MIFKKITKEDTPSDEDIDHPPWGIIFAIILLGVYYFSASIQYFLLSSAYKLTRRVCTAFYEGPVHYLRLSDAWRCSICYGSRSPPLANLLRYSSILSDADGSPSRSPLISVNLAPIQSTPKHMLNEVG